MTTDRTLYQFPISHYCEKSRWNLDSKGLGYTVRNLVPGAHGLVTRRKAGTGTVPVLVDRGVGVGDSTAIALYLDREYPAHPLIPAGGPERTRVLGLEEYFDKAAGVAVRRWLYDQILGVEGLAPEIIFRDYGPATRSVGRALGPLIALGLRRLYGITPPRVAASRAVIDEVLDRLETETERDPARYLVGGRLTLADITAASLLGPLVAPPGSPWADGAGLPPAVLQLRASVRARPAGQWVLARYAHDRGGAATA